MPWNDAYRLITQERKKKRVAITKKQAGELYRRTGGLPLALVWSIALMGFGYDVDTVLARLGMETSDIAKYCFQSAVEHIRGQPPHTVLMALSLFAGSGSRRALGAVTELPPLELSDGLVDLELLSLVNKYEDRFTLLPLTKAFAFTELKRDPALEKRIADNWIDYLITTFKRADDLAYWRFKGEEFYQEGENIREALEWSYEQGSSDQVFALSHILIDYLDDTGRWNEMLACCERVSSLAESIQDPTYIARFQNSKGWLLEQRGEYDEAVRVSKTALNQYQLMGNQRGEAKMLQRISALYRKLEDYDLAKEKCDQAMALAKKLDDSNLIVLIEHEYGKLARSQKDWEQAKTHFLNVQKWFQEIAEQAPHDEQLSWGVAGHLAIVEYHLGNPQQAKELCLRSLEFFEGYGTRGYMAVLYYRLALAEEALGEHAAALEHVQKALKWFDRLGMKPDYDNALPLLHRLQES
jgi:LuxR family glucitol operon transcriptional activator